MWGPGAAWGGGLPGGPGRGRAPNAPQAPGAIGDLSGVIGIRRQAPATSCPGAAWPARCAPSGTPQGRRPWRSRPRLACACASALASCSRSLSPACAGTARPGLLTACWSRTRRAGPPAPSPLFFFSLPCDHGVRRPPPAPAGDAHRLHGWRPPGHGLANCRRDARGVWARHGPARPVPAEAPRDAGHGELAVHEQHGPHAGPLAHGLDAPVHGGERGSDAVAGQDSHGVKGHPHAVGCALRSHVPFPPRRAAVGPRAHRQPGHRAPVPACAVHAKRHGDLRGDLAAPMRRAQVARGRRAQVAQRAARVARPQRGSRPAVLTLACERRRRPQAAPKTP